MTPSTIAAVGNAQGWRTRKGQPWNARHVLYMLTNHIYAGLVLDGYGFRDGCHQRLVERSFFHEVQNLLVLRSSRTPPAV
ncbi:MAG: recombinase family protein [Acidobacteriales bacterium]|nr:recombinase family protein [Terriglobales bacterium]